MAYDLEEQERIAALQDWWAANRIFVLGAIVAAFVGTAGYQLYKHLRTKAADEAAVSFKEIEAAAKANDSKKVGELTEKLTTGHPKSFDASKAALIAAKAAFDANDLPKARGHLEWVASNGEASHRAVARVRLAVVLLDEKKFDEALKQLDLVREEGYAPLVNEVRGDVFLAQNRMDEARAAYKAALDKADQRNPSRQILETKLSAVGGTPTPPAPIGQVAGGK